MVYKTAGYGCGRVIEKMDETKKRAIFKNNMSKKDGVWFAVGVLAAAVIAVLDIFIKQIIKDKVNFNGEIVVIKKFFSITHVRNTGAAWGIFSSATDILSIVTIIASVLMLYVIYASTVNKMTMLCFSSVLGGAVGNLIERMHAGYVTDFLSFNIFGYHFPHFNFADICITVGCIMLLAYVFFIHKKNTPYFRDGTIALRIFGE